MGSQHIIRHTCFALANDPLCLQCPDCNKLPDRGWNRHSPLLCTSEPAGRTRAGKAWGGKTSKARGPDQGAGGGGVGEGARGDGGAAGRELVDGDKGEVAVLHQRERAGDGRGRHVHHVRRRARLRRQPRPLLHPKPAPMP